MDRSKRTFLAAIATISMASMWPLGSPARVHAQPGQPVTLATGQFVGADSSHQGEGRALVIRLPDGQRFLRFENFKVTNGPDLYVYLSGHPAPRNSGQLHQGAAHQIGLLKGNIGNQNYALPADLDLSKFKSVAIYCKRFSVMFASAELTVRP
ncbi:MAG: DM13 domain-containing protein [Armatimonadota bacterium]